MLNQNYTCCIFIRTDCEIWAVKTWVIVALETDISHFPSRSWKWHANFVFNVCAPFFVWLLCISAKKLQDEVDWEETAQMKRKRSEMEVLIGSCMFSVCHTRCRNQGVVLLILSSPTCASLLSYHLATSRALIQTSAHPSQRTNVHPQTMLLTDNNKKRNKQDFQSCQCLKIIVGLVQQEQR